MRGGARVINGPAMKILRMFPLAFFADVHGFILFAPYLALVLTAFYVVNRRQTQRAAVVIERRVI